ncbi:MAG TPA: hypothetical protein VD811_04190 [Desulfuromonadales bacterium]|nr:hypothetical protein [Desulfuromonadales bacterium]
MVAHREGSHGLALLRGLMRQPVVMANDVARIVGVSYTKANSLIAVCENLGSLRQISSGERNRKFIYNDYVGILSEGPEIGPGEGWSARGDGVAGRCTAVTSGVDVGAVTGCSNVKMSKLTLEAFSCSS